MVSCLRACDARQDFMTGFNFLPWREEKRHQKKAIFNRLALLQIILGLSIVIVIWIFNEEKLKIQNEKIYFYSQK